MDAFSVKCKTHPFHAVSRRKLSKLGFLTEDGDICGIRQLRVVCSTSEVFFPGRLGFRVQLSGDEGKEGDSSDECCGELHIDKLVDFDSVFSPLQARFKYFQRVFQGGNGRSVGCSSLKEWIISPEYDILSNLSSSPLDMMEG